MTPTSMKMNSAHHAHTLSQRSCIFLPELSVVVETSDAWTIRGRPLHLHLQGNHQNSIRYPSQLLDSLSNAKKMSSPMKINTANQADS